ncbi:MAG TPA: hypothetical protein VKB59_22510 [Micromonosporaceae bacterium]|nr:hypothetical protein [Micromonosporaceae bacterium]
MAYATVDQLAAALRIAVTAKNQDALQLSLDAAAQVVDHLCDRPADDPMPTPTPPLAVTENIAIGIEVFKANDAAFGAVGFSDIGVLSVPADVYARHAVALVPLKVQFGIA